MVKGILSHLLKRDDGPRTGELVIDGRRLPVTFRRHAGARRIVLRLDRERDGIVLTLPPGASAQTALEFAARQAGWIWTRLERAPESVPFLPGEAVPVRGVGHAIVHEPVARGLVRVETGETLRLVVPGGHDHVPRRVADWLKAEARRDLLARSRHHAEAMEARFARVSVRDTVSRWGSCSTDGNLSYSWRLILTPPFVLDYVCAHEVAHLKHMNHGPRFWALVEQHAPRMDEARAWLKREGARLQRYGG
jgi:predicted metal-dependent hydrolase